jgi:hypothetical protein
LRDDIASSRLTLMFPTMDTVAVPAAYVMNRHDPSANSQFAPPECRLQKWYRCRSCGSLIWPGRKKSGVPFGAPGRSRTPNTTSVAPKYGLSPDPAQSHPYSWVLDAGRSPINRVLLVPSEIPVIFTPEFTYSIPSWPGNFAVVLGLPVPAVMVRVTPGPSCQAQLLAVCSALKVNVALDVTDWVVHDVGKKTWAHRMWLVPLARVWSVVWLPEATWPRP